MKLLFLYISFFAILLQAKVLTQSECIEKTLKNHPDIKKLSYTLSKTNSLVDIAKSDYLPQVHLNAQYNPINTFVMPQNGGFNTTNDDSWHVGVQLNQKIYDFSKTTSTISAFKKENEIASLLLEEQKASLAYNVKIQYNMILLQTEALEVRKKDFQTKKELYNQAKAFVNEGLKTDADALSLLSAMYIAQENLAITQSELNKALSTLSLYMGEKIDSNTTFKDESSNKNIKDTQTILKNILENNHDIKSKEQEIYKNHFLYEASKAQHYGSIDAIASYTYQDTLNEYDTSLVGISINIPIYSGGRVDAQTQQMRLAKDESKEIYNSKKLLLEDEMQRLIIDLKKYRYTIKAKEALLKSSQATKEIVEARYKEGLSTYIEVLDASSTYLFASLGILEVQFSINNILNRLDYLQGIIQ